MSTLMRWPGLSVPTPNNEGAFIGPHPITNRDTLIVHQESHGITYHNFGNLGLNFDVYSGRLNFRLTAYPSSSNTIFYSIESVSPYGNNFRVLITSSGNLRFQDASSNDSTSLGTYKIPVNEDHTLLWKIAAIDGVVEWELYNSDNELVDTNFILNGSFSKNPNLRIGVRLASPTVPQFYVWDVMMTDEYEWIPFPEIKFGTTPIRNAYIGDDPIKSIYFGNKLVYM